MPYDEKSFLQGLAVGRSLKGVQVLNPNGSGAVKVAYPIIRAGQMMHFYLTVPNAFGCTISFDSMTWDINGERIERTVAIPPQMGQGTLTAIAVPTPQPIYPVDSGTIPNTMGAIVEAEATITIDE